MARGSPRGGAVRGRGRGRGRGHKADRIVKEVVKHAKPIEKQDAANNKKKSKCKVFVEEINNSSNNSKKTQKKEKSYDSALVDSTVEMARSNKSSNIVSSEEKTQSDELTIKTPKSKHNPLPAENHLPTFHSKTPDSFSTLDISENNVTSIATSTEKDQFINSKPSSIVQKFIISEDNTIRNNAFTPQYILYASNTSDTHGNSIYNLEREAISDKLVINNSANYKNLSSISPQRIITNQKICSCSNSSLHPIPVECNLQQPQTTNTHSICSKSNNQISNKGDSANEDPNYKQWINKLNRIDKQLKKYNKQRFQYHPRQFHPRQRFQSRIRRGFVHGYAAPQQPTYQQQWNAHPGWSTSDTSLSLNTYHRQQNFTPNFELYSYATSYSDESARVNSPLPTYDGASSNTPQYSYGTEYPAEFRYSYNAERGAVPQNSTNEVLESSVPLNSNSQEYPPNYYF